MRERSTHRWQDQSSYRRLLILTFSCIVITIMLCWILLQDCEQRANNNKFKLRDLLALPMQRILKYSLLMKELIKETDKGDIGRQTLTTSLEAMQVSATGEQSRFISWCKVFHSSYVCFEVLFSPVMIINVLWFLQDLSLYVNEVKRDNEHLQLIREIQLR